MPFGRKGWGFPLGGLKIGGGVFDAGGAEGAALAETVADGVALGVTRSAVGGAGGVVAGIEGIGGEGFEGLDTEGAALAEPLGAPEPDMRFEISMPPTMRSPSPTPRRISFTS